jgi:hypothetical protein
VDYRKHKSVRERAHGLSCNIACKWVWRCSRVSSFGVGVGTLTLLWTSGHTPEHL